ncbi:MAG: ornithine carbamoyltransferase [Chloroherpetonaceae bacterium]|nr:ornithine carbamoyltransferase [Chloroherpetonaceae bacterium]
MKSDFLSLQDIEGREELFHLFELCDALKADRTVKPLAGKTVALLFQKPSLRTRVSFEVGVVELGGYPIYLGQESVGLGKRESVADVARVLSRYNDLIIARLFEHSVLLELAEYASVPVINALTNHSHPCQVFADLYTMRQHGKLFEGVKVVFVGDGNNVVNSWLEMSMLYPMHFVLAAPPAYNPHVATLKAAMKAGVSKIEILEDPEAAVRDADVVYTDVWTSMGQEDEAEERRKAFQPYQVNARLLSLAKPTAILMHCLPANRGEEVTDEVLDGKQSVVFDQAENRLHAQKAILVTLLQKSVPKSSPRTASGKRKRLAAAE